VFLFESLLNECSTYETYLDSSLSTFTSLKPKLDGIRLFYYELLPRFTELALDPLGNLVFQKFIGFLILKYFFYIFKKKKECCSKIQELSELFMGVCDSISPDIITLSFNFYGCRVLSKVSFIHCIFLFILYQYLL
jgi:hypothetical protein